MNAIHMGKLQATSCKRQAKHRTRWAMISIAVLGVLGFALAVAPVAHAAVETGIEFATATGLAVTDVRIVVARIIRTFLGLLGIVGVGIVLYGGFLWMTAGGEEERITTAKRMLANGGIGIAIILSAFSIAQFVLSRLEDAAGRPRGTSSTQSLLGETSLSGALGAGPIVRHLPPRDASCESVPSNTRIFITFRSELRAQSVAADTNGNGSYATTGADGAAFDNYRDLALPEAIQVARVGADVDWTRLTAQARQDAPAAFAAEVAKLTPVGIALTADRKTIVLAPVVTGGDGRVVERAGGGAQRAFLAGDARNPVAYVVRLTDAIRAADGSAIFTGAFRDGYAWSFTVCADADLTPPKISSVVPFPDLVAGRDGTSVVGVRDQPRNVLVQVTFNEAVDPTVTTGTLTRNEIDGGVTTAADSGAGFTFLAVRDTVNEKRIAGAYAVSNGYRTVEFTTTEACGQNSCGGTVYCLPGQAALRGEVQPAVLEVAGEFMGLPFSGVMDAAGNSFDGNGNGASQGPGAPFDLHLAANHTGALDTAHWRFFTTNTIDLVAPVIEEIVHYGKDGDALGFNAASGIGVAAENVSLAAPFTVLFSRLMSGTTAEAIALAETTGGIIACDPISGRGCLWHSGALAHEPAGDAPVKSRVTVAHRALAEAQPGFAVPTYRVHVDSSARDIYQNCFFTLGATPSGPRGPRGGESCVRSAGAETCTSIP